MRFGPFEIERPLGRGGMAETFVATLRGAQGFTRTVCLKRILAEHAASPAFVRAFQDEARLAMRLVHPHIAQVYDYGEVDGTWWMSLELVGGGDLRNLLRNLGQPLPLDLALLLAIDLASALMYAHELVVDGQPARLVHRDVSPSNVLIDEQGNFKLVDFGIAKSALSGSETTTGKIKGKACYMAPEQGLGRKLDARADLWALGAVLYEALSGVRPFDAASDLATILLVTQGERKKLAEVAPHVPADVCEVIEKLLAVELDARYPSAAALLDALENRPPPPNARRRLADILRKLSSGEARSEPAPPPASRPEATLAVTALALGAAATEEPVAAAPDDETRTRTVFDAALGRSIEAGAFDATMRHDSLSPSAPRTVPPGPPSAPSVVVAADARAPAGTSPPPSGVASRVTWLVLLVGLLGALLGAAIAALLVRGPAPSIEEEAVAAGGPADAAGALDASRAPDAAVLGAGAPTSLDAAASNDVAELADVRDVEAVPDAPEQDQAGAPVSDGDPGGRSGPRVRDGRVEVVVVPWGRVFIDGTDVGRAPYRGRLAAGPHRIEAVAGELRASRTVRVQAGGSQRISIPLGE